MVQRPFLVGVAGATCSGKTTLEKGLQGHYGDVLDVLPFDDMCYRYDELPEDVRGDWEEPQQYKMDEYVDHLRHLRNGRRVCFSANSAQSFQEGITVRCVEPRPLVLSVGFLALQDCRARELFDLKLFIDLPESEIEERRVVRDSSYGRIDETALRQYVREHIIPAHREHVEPQVGYADVLVSAMQSQATILNDVITAIEQHRPKI